MENILIIADEKVLLDVLQKKLNEKGYKVFVAQDGEEGLEKIKKAKPDLILVDILMPKKDGFEVLAEIRRRKETAKTPVIVISNSGEPSELDRAEKLGAKDYLIKAEFEPDKALAKIETILKERGREKKEK